jgi:predicted RNA-binding Zn-ribbon protein involved in translation (DUF1610 family)
MDLFAIICTTCKSRLRVREEGVIGQILPCPKCGGMVMIKAPEGWEPGKPLPPPRPEPPAGLTAVVEMKRKDDTSSDADFDEIEDILANAPPKPRTAVVTVAPDAPGLARPRFVGHAHQQPAGGSGITKGAAAAGVAAAEPPIIAMESKPAPAADSAPGDGAAVPDFRPPPGRTWSYYLLLAASVLAGVGLAFAVVVASASFFRGELKQAAQVGVPAPQPVSGQPTAPGQPVAVQPSNAAATSPADSVTPTPSSTAVPQAPVAAASTASQVDPPSRVTPPVKPAGPQQADDPFRQILEPDTGPVEKTETPAAKPATPPMDPMEQETPAKPVAPRPDPRTVDVPARLADPLASLETEGTPLADFLQVMSDLSTIPITLEPDALPLAQANATSPVVLKLSNTTVGAALTAGLSRLGLEHVPTEGQLIVRLIEPAEMKVLIYPHKDLTGGDSAAATDLAELIQAVVDPPSWTLGDAGATIEVEDSLKIKQRRANHAQIFLLCEKLRTARKLQYASKYPPALFQLDSRTKQATAKLKTPVSLNLHQPTPLLKILRQLEEAVAPAGQANRSPPLRILVDWRDIAAGGWNPDAEATLVVEKDSLALALQKLLEPMDLAWRVVDGQTVQVVSPQTLANRCELELFPAGDLVKDDPSGQRLIAAIRETLGEALFRDQGGPCELRFEPAAQCVVASLPQPKQQELEVFLMSLRRPQ